jgi:hypothetical protein
MEAWIYPKIVNCVHMRGGVNKKGAMISQSIYEQKTSKFLSDVFNNPISGRTSVLDWFSARNDMEGFKRGMRLERSIYNAPLRKRREAEVLMACMNEISEMDGKDDVEASSNRRSGTPWVPIYRDWIVHAHNFCQAGNLEAVKLVSRYCTLDTVCLRSSLLSGNLDLFRYVYDKLTVGELDDYDYSKLYSAAMVAADKWRWDESSPYEGKTTAVEWLNKVMKAGLAELDKTPKSQEGKSSQYHYLESPWRRFAPRAKALGYGFFNSDDKESATYLVLDCIYWFSLTSVSRCQCSHKYLWRTISNREHCLKYIPWFLEHPTFQQDFPLLLKYLCMKRRISCILKLL